MRYPPPIYLFRPQLRGTVPARAPALAGLGGTTVPVSEDIDLQTNYGIFSQPRAMTAEYAVMEQTLIQIIDEKVQAIPWLPAGWMNRINQARAAYPDWRFILLPCLSQWGTRLPTAPAWLDSEEKLAAWNSIAKDMQNAIFTFSQQKVEEGQAILDSLYSTAAFWDTVYTIDKAIADAPAAFIKAAGTFSTDIVGTFLKSFWPVLLVVGAGAVLYYGRDKIFPALGSRAARAIRG